MEVILLQHVDNLGRRGEVVKVRPGYARNYLVPRGLVAAATPGAKRRVEQESRKFVEQDNKARNDATAVAEKLAAIELTVAVKADEDGKLYGSVSPVDLQHLLVAQGVTLERRQIGLDQPFKQLGDFEVPVKLHLDVRSAIKLHIVRE